MIKLTMDFETDDISELIMQVAMVVGVFGTERCTVTSVHAPHDGKSTATAECEYESPSELIESLAEAVGGEE